MNNWSSFTGAAKALNLRKLYNINENEWKESSSAQDLLAFKNSGFFSLCHRSKHNILSKGVMMKLELEKETESEKRGPVVWNEGAVARVEHAGEAFNWAIVAKTTQVQSVSETVREFY